MAAEAPGKFAIKFRRAGQVGFAELTAVDAEAACRQLQARHPCEIVSCWVSCERRKRQHRQAFEQKRGGQLVGGVPIDDVEQLNLLDFRGMFNEILQAGEPVAIARYGLVEGYFIPAGRLDG